MEQNTSTTYDASQIQILEGLEAVRKRPGMYVGSTSATGLHHMVYEIVDNAVDEALAGYCTEVFVALNQDGSVTVTDNGRGIPAGIQKKTGKSAIEVVFTILHAGGKFGDGGYKISGGLHGVGASVVNALSKWLKVTVMQDGNIYQQQYACGKPESPLKNTGQCSGDCHGTTVTFYPDATIFDTIEFDYRTLQMHLRETAFLTKGLAIHLSDERRSGDDRQSDDFCYENGIEAFISWLNEGKAILHPQTLYGEAEYDGMCAEIALQYNDTFTESVYSFVNNIYTPEGGTHLTGFRNALTRAVNEYGRSHNLIKEQEPSLNKDDLKEGLTAVISVKMENPQFEGQTKQKLGSSEARTNVEALAYPKITYFLEQNPTAAKAIFDKCLLAQRAKAAARKARELTRRKTGLESLSLPGKLSDCSSKDPSECEIFIVEGDSAGGSAKSARTRATQAVLPLRGKILNVEKARLDKIYSNAEIKAMITAFGTGILEEFNLGKLRYHKIILMTDADVDGAHITTLLLTFLFRFMPELIRAGHVYLAQPPLYKIEKNRKAWYAYSDSQLNQILEEIGRDGTNKIQRYKGLGEMDAEQLWETTMDPAQRTLLKVTMSDEDLLSVERTFSTLMGEDVEPRRNFINENAQYAIRDI